MGTCLVLQKLLPGNLKSKLIFQGVYKMAKMDFSGVEEEVVTREEFPLVKSTGSIERMNWWLCLAMVFRDLPRR